LVKNQTSSDKWHIFNSGGNVYLGVKNVLSMNGNDVAVETSESGAVVFFHPERKTAEPAENLMNLAEYNKIRFAEGYDPYEMELPLLARGSDNKIVEEVSAASYFSKKALEEIRVSIEDLANGDNSPLLGKKKKKGKSSFGRR
jgi:hypothetical protein